MGDNKYIYSVKIGEIQGLKLIELLKKLKENNL